MTKFIGTVQRGFTPQLRKFLYHAFDNFKIDPDGNHGLNHWLRVMENGAILSMTESVDYTVLKYFALAHDMERTTEHHCERHGTDAAKKLRILRNDTDLLIELNDEQFQKLLRACSGHTVGLHDSDMTIGACWDSDRLDLNRVDIYPDADYMTTDTAKDEELIKLRSESLDMRGYWHDILYDIQNNGPFECFHKRSWL